MSQGYCTTTGRVAHYEGGDMRTLGELAAALFDSLCCGDLLGHLRAWLDVARGRVTANTRYDLAAGNE